MLATGLARRRKQGQHPGAVTGSGAVMNIVRMKKRAQVKPAAIPSRIETDAHAVRAKPAASSIETAAVAKARAETVAAYALPAATAATSSYAEVIKLPLCYLLAARAH